MNAKLLTMATLLMLSVNAAQAREKSSDAEQGTAKATTENWQTVTLPASDPKTGEASASPDISKAEVRELERAKEKAQKKPAKDSVIDRSMMLLRNTFAHSTFVH